MIFTAPHPNEDPRWIIVLEEEREGAYTLIGYLNGTVSDRCDYSKEYISENSKKMISDLQEIKKQIRLHNTKWNNRLIKGIESIELQLKTQEKYETEW